MPPTNPPIAVPICSSSLPPSPISQERPGICARAPTAARTIASSAIRAPMPSTPIIALGISAATAPNATIMPDSRPIPAMVFTNTLVSSPARASMMPEKNAAITFTAA